MADLNRGRQGQGHQAGEESISSALEAVYELNVRCLTLLQRLAQEHPGGLPHFLFDLTPEFRRLDESTISVVAHQPFALVDYAFGNPQLLGVLLTRGPELLRFPRQGATLPAAEAAALARGALILAREICRYHSVHAGLLLGLDPSLQELISQLRLADMERVAEENPQYLRIRWEGRVDIWRDLLSLAHSSDPGAGEGIRMYGIQLMAGELNRKTRGRR